MKIHSKTIIIASPYPSVTNPFNNTYKGFWEIKANLSLERRFGHADGDAAGWFRK